jgi:hypothetical protein
MLHVDDLSYPPCPEQIVLIPPSCGFFGRTTKSCVRGEWKSTNGFARLSLSSSTSPPRPIVHRRRLEALATFASSSLSLEFTCGLLTHYRSFGKVRPHRWKNPEKDPAGTPEVNGESKKNGCGRD